jgi:hypothetical protein
MERSSSNEVTDLEVKCRCVWAEFLNNAQGFVPHDERKSAIIGS